MIRPVRTARGQPLLALSMILGSWVLVRAAVLQSGEAGAAGEVSAMVARSPDTALLLPTPKFQAAAALVLKPRLEPVETGPVAPVTAPRVLPSPVAPLAPAASLRLAPAWGSTPSPSPASSASIAPAPKPAFGSTGPVSPRVAAAHQLLWMAALAQLPSPSELSPPPKTPPSPKPATPVLSRWSGDGWLLWRRDGAGPIGGGFAPSSYGASQAGAVLRYRLAPSSAHRPAIYLRATSALEMPRGEEAALGLSVRPLPRVPVTAMLEARATRLQAGTRLRPAAALVSQFPPFDLPLKARAETYVQLGYVGGTGSTAFVDGQFKVDGPLLRIGRSELRVGGGVWGGAQEAASRLDAGPSATLGLPLGKANARLAMDWRFRVAGNAAPRSGPAMTLSAGF